MKSIYDMMGRHTYPLLREEAPLEHMERFFQVSAAAGGGWGPVPGTPGKAAPLSGPLPPTLLVVRIKE